MIIKIIPETEAEKRRIKKVEHKGVKEFFIFGNKKEEDGDLVDFHDWTGGFRYLMGSLEYFKSLVGIEMVSKHKENANEISLMPPNKTANQKGEIPNVVPFIKRGSPIENNVQTVVMAEDLNKVVDISEIKPIVEDERDETKEVTEENEGAKDENSKKND